MKDLVIYKENLIIYTDGSTRIKNQKGFNNIGGYGYVVFKDDTIIDAFGKQVENTTNNRMELTAIIEAMKKYGSTGYDVWDCPTIYTDSQYALNCLTVWGPVWKLNNWIKQDNKTPENLDLVQEGLELLDKYYFSIVKCDGHSGIEGNELADKLATGIISREEVLKIPTSNQEY